jgi:lipopolysaccharide transport system permease protein
MPFPSDATVTADEGGWWVIEPRQNTLFQRAREVWEYRNLFWYFASNSLTTLYRRTALGWFWLLMRVWGPIGLNSVIFGSVLQAPSDGATPYFLFFLCGTVTWTLFDRALFYITRSVEQNKRLVSKVYFPRMILPIAGAAPALIYLAVLLVVLAATVGFFRYTRGIWYIALEPRLLAAVAAMVLTMIFAVAVGLFTSVLQVRYRDVRYGLRYFMPFWFYLTPVIYPLAHMARHLPPQWQWLVALNPMGPVVELFKWATLGEGSVRAIDLTIAITLIALTTVAGIWFFTREEAASVDKL